jgi:hypothetical protein
MNIEPGTASLLIVAATQGIQVFTSLMPAHCDVLASSPDDQPFVTQVRQSELLSTVLVMGVACLISYFTKNGIALVVGAASCITMITAYEISLQKRG